MAAVSRRGADQGLDARGGHRAADQEALPVAAAHLPQYLQLHRILDALRDHLDAEVPADLHDRAGQQGHRVIVPQPGHERRVDLDDVHRQPAQVGQRRVAGTEVVDGEPHAQASQVRQAPDHQAAVLDEDPLGDLEDERLRRQAALGERGRHGLGEPGRVDLSQGQVDRHPNVPAGGPPRRALGAGGGQHPGAERNDQAGIFGHVEEVGGRDSGAVAPPPDQGLDAGDAGGLQLDYWLVLDGELLAGDRALQVTGQFQPADHVRVHVRGEDLDTAATAVSGLGHRDIGVAQHEPGGRAVRERDPDACGQGDVPAGHPERRGADGPGHPLGDVRDVLETGGAVDERGELVTAPAGHSVVRGHDRAEPPGRLREHQVAGAVTDRVVDRGEAVQVEEDDARFRAIAAVAQRVPRPLLQVGPVGQAGQPVVEGQVGHLLAQRDLVAHVARGDQQLIGLSGHAVPHDRRFDVPPGTVRGPDPDREPAHHVPVWACGVIVLVPWAGRAERGAGGAQGQHTVLGMEEILQSQAGQLAR